MFSSTFWWTVLGIVLMICEFAAPGLILFFFGIGALVVALVVWLVPMSLTWQIALFLIASLIALFALRRWLKSIFTGRSSAENTDALSEGMTGMECTVSQPIAPSQPGKVMLNGTAWKAESDETLGNGQLVVVVEQKSLTLIVKSK